MDAFKPTTAHKLDFKILMEMQPCPLTEILQLMTKIELQFIVRSFKQKHFLLNLHLLKK